MDSAFLTPVAGLWTRRLYGWPDDATSSGQQDRLLFERGVAALERQRFDLANLTLQTLVNTYPNSSYATAAKTLLEDPHVEACGAAWNSDPACFGRGHSSF